MIDCVAQEPYSSEGILGTGKYLFSSEPVLQVCESVPSYSPRDPEQNPIYGVLSDHLETFLEQQRRRDRTVPRFVERELRSFLECGVLAHGFLRVHCDACGQDLVVPFSCKGRGFCSCCGGRRMADTAAHLVDRVLPEVPIRQWVLSLPFALRYHLAYDADLVRDVLRIFVRAVFASLRRRTRLPSGNRLPRCGAVTFIQRFGDSLNLNVHFHMLALDVVYSVDDKGFIHFQPAPPPSDAKMVRVVARILRRLERLVEKRGLGQQADPEEVDSLGRTQPLLSELYGASISGRIATGRRAGWRVTRVGDKIDFLGSAIPTGPRCAYISGISLHANVRIPAHDRMRLERLCRYAARPPVAAERLSLLPHGRLLYRLRRRWSDGTDHVIFEPLELIEKLAALVPPPRFNLIRYHGVLAPAAGWRSLITPQPKETSEPLPHSNCSAAPSQDEDSAKVLQRHPRNYSWAELMRRVFDVDVLECPNCHGRMRILAAIHPPEAIEKILCCLGLPPRPPPIAPAAVDCESLF